MPRKHYKPEEIAAKLRQVDVLTSQDQNLADAIRAFRIIDVSFATSCSMARSFRP